MISFPEVEVLKALPIGESEVLASEIAEACSTPYNIFIVNVYSVPSMNAFPKKCRPKCDTEVFARPLALWM